MPTYEETEEYILNAAEEIRKRLHIAGCWPSRNRFLNFRYKENGEFDGLQYEGLVMSGLECTKARERIKERTVTRLTAKMNR